MLEPHLKKRKRALFLRKRKRAPLAALTHDARDMHNGLAHNLNMFSLG
jgi:hypothetical protein